MLKELVPFNYRQERSPVSKTAQVVPANSDVAKLFKVVTLALGLSHGWANTRQVTFESAPYDFDRIIEAADTDSFVKQAFLKYKELLWKSGWDLVGENDESVDYVYERIDYMEYAMGRPFQSLLEDIGDQLIKFGNAFVAKSRGDLTPYFPGQLNRIKDKDPIVGYYVIPAETVEILRNKNNKVLGYRQSFDNLVDGFTNKRQPRWRPEDVIHFAVDRKPGRAFGTPFIVSALDDVIALRQMEEDIQNLVHQELFPLYKYTVGTPEHPADPDEIDAAAQELAHLRSDGGLVLPDRHNVEVIGAEHHSLDASSYLKHFLTRVITGLGLSAHHLGIMNDGGNRSVTDRLDVALYDKIKNYQTYISDMIRLNIFGEILMEGGYDPIVHPAVQGESDRVEFRFREIDVDTQVKKESHEIQKYAAGAISLPELRLALSMDPDVEEGLLQQAVSARLQPQQIRNPDGTTTTQVPERPDAQAPSTGGRSNSKNTMRGVGNKVRPSNQHGRRTSPNIRHSLSESDERYLYDVVHLIGDNSEGEL